jgi:hypothetical protein
VAAAIVRDATVTFLGEEKHLIFESIGAQGPAVAKDDRLSATPIVVINLDLTSVFFSDGDVGHVDLLSA